MGIVETQQFQQQDATAAHFFLWLYLALQVLASEEELIIRINQLQTVPIGDFIPVYSTIKDFSAPFVNSKEKDEAQILSKAIERTAASQAEPRNYNGPNSISETEISGYEPLDDTINVRARNFQSIPEQRNFQSVPALSAENLQNYQIPELTNLQLPAIASPALRSFQPAPISEATSSGRTLKHFLLLRSFLGGGGGSGNGGFGQIIYPIIVNTPVNVTNMNNNNVTNVPAAPAGGGGAGDDPNAGLRINYIGIPQTQSFPMQQLPLQNLQMPNQVYPQPTAVYNQRQAVATAQPTYAVSMLNMPGSLPFMPFSAPQYQSSVNRNNGDAERRRHALGWPNASKNQNPWSAFANNLRGLQFL